MSQTAYRKLLFEGVLFRNLEEGLNPVFLCPGCRHKWHSNLVLGTSFPETFDYNQKVEFTIQNHDTPDGESCSATGEKIELFVALHKDANGIILCVQSAESTSGIPENWWVNSE